MHVCVRVCVRRVCVCVSVCYCDCDCCDCVVHVCYQKECPLLPSINCLLFCYLNESDMVGCVRVGR